MIYLCGSQTAAAEWGHDHGIDTSTLNRDVRVCSRLDQAQGCRPRPSDRIVLIDGREEAALAYDYLIHAQELARRRRDTSLRQAP